MCGSKPGGPRAMPPKSAERNGIGRARARRHPGHGATRWAMHRRPAPCRSCSSPSDPVGAGFVDSLARPGGNVTVSCVRIRPVRKRLELLKQIAPGVTRAAVLRDPANCRNRRVCRHPVHGAVARGGGEPVNMRDASEIERAVTAFAHAPNGGLIVTGAGPRSFIANRSSRWRPGTNCLRSTTDRSFAAAGGLVSYGPDYIDRPARGRLRRPHPQGREARGLACAGANQVRTGDQSQNGEGARTRPCRRRCLPAPTR